MQRLPRLVAVWWPPAAAEAVRLPVSLPKAAGAVAPGACAPDAHLQEARKLTPQQRDRLLRALDLQQEQGCPMHRIRGYAGAGGASRAFCWGVAAG